MGYAHTLYPYCRHELVSGRVQENATRFVIPGFGVGFAHFSYSKTRPFDELNVEDDPVPLPYT